MKKLIKEVLDDLKFSQVNLESKASREMIANLVSAALKAKGSYKEYTDYEIDEQKAKASWVCVICGKSTYELDYDYLGSGANHLSCELRLEQDEKYREKNWSQKKHEDKVFNDYVEDIDEQAYAQGRGSSHRVVDDAGVDIKTGKYVGDSGVNSLDIDSDENVKLRDEVFEKQKQLFEDAGDGHMLKVQADSPYNDGWTRQYHKDKLSEEIIEGQEGKWIYESPDGGKTVFRRPFSNYDPKYKEEINWETKEPTGRVFTQYPFPPSETPYYDAAHNINSESGHEE